MSSQLTFSSFAVAGGAGSLGAFITSELLAQGAKVTVLSSKSADVPAGATLAIVDYANKDSLVAAIKGAEVVISAVSGPGMAHQPLLVQAAKEAGVKHFVPSEFGMRTTDLPLELQTGAIGEKIKVQKLLREAGLTYTLYYVGLFSDWFFIPLFGFDFANKKISIVGPGNTPISWTSRKDIGYFVAYTLTHLPKSRLENQPLDVEDEKLTFNQIVDILQEVRGEKFEVTHTSVEEAENAVKEKGHDALVEFINLQAHRGYLDGGKTDNHLIPGFKPQSVREAVASTL
ncbi:NAD(P)-binding protein [Auriculariales sp. MPI-PUGE-AT-0066]|nr:NAD(P)-binding protein [Auriculariales sp. MPI-PUGE-AT-0066]